jgi:hypothetical protein
MAGKPNIDTGKRAIKVPSFLSGVVVAAQLGDFLVTVPRRAM